MCDLEQYHGVPTPVEIQQVHCEFERVLSIFTDLQPKRVLELGVHQGGTLYHWLRLAPLVVGVDLRDPQAVWDTWGPGKLIYIQGNTHSAETGEKIKAAGAPFDFAHIDADHLEESAQRDWEIVYPLMRPGGIVVFHDALLVAPAYGVNVLPVIRRIEDQGYAVERIQCRPKYQTWGTSAAIRV